MTNKKLIEKLQEDMDMRGFSHYTKDSYLRKTKEIIKYFGKPMREVTTKELRYFLLKYLREVKKVGERSVNYYNSVIRFIYDVVLDYPINQKQLPMYKKKRMLPKILSEEELNVFFNACDNYMYKTIFMMIYGSGLRISEATNIRIEDIDSKNMRILVREGKESKYRYTLLSQTNLDILREYFKVYRPNHKENYLFISQQTNDKYTVSGPEIAFREIRKKAGIKRKVTVHGLRHNFATDLIENGLDILHLQKLLGHSGIRSTMEYLHLANVEKDIVSPLDRLYGSGDENA